MILDEKYVLHIPLCKYADGKLVSIDIEDVLEDFISKLAENGYENLYMVKAKGYYKSRCFDEILITIYASSNCNENQALPNDIFVEWFKCNNDVLEQEAMGYEYNGKMVITEL